MNEIMTFEQRFRSNRELACMSASAPRAADEPERVAALRRLALLDTERTEAFDRIVRLVARVFEVPTVLVSLVDADRQWIKASVGAAFCETCREDAFCGRTILSDGLLVVPNAAADPRFKENPLVTGPTGIRFYAGAPVRSPDGFRVGTLCVIDTVPRAGLDEFQRATLIDFAAMVEAEIARHAELRADVTAREAERHHLAEHVDAAFTASPVAMMTVSHGRVTAWNPAAETLFGWSASEVLDGPIPQVGVEDRAECARLTARIHAGETIQGHETWRTRKDGSRVAVSISAAPMIGPDDAYAGALLMMEDISGRKAAEAERARTMDELKEARDAALAADEAKTRFLANMSHELRTPLNAVIGFGELLALPGGPGASENRRMAYAGDIVASGRHLLGIINSVLDMMKAETGMLVLDVEDVPVEDLVNEAMTMIAPIADECAVTLALSGEVPKDSVRGDRVKLRQVLLNVLCNAAKFSHPGGTVGITAEALGAGAVIRVVDEGIGMDAAGIRKAFEPFGQVDDRLERKHEGTGLGLPLSRDIMDLHGGTLTLESQPGHGTTVTIKIPDDTPVH